jgi:hypothetical protein
MPESRNRLGFAQYLGTPKINEIILQKRLTQNFFLL